MSNHYDILKIKPQASIQEIKQAYRDLARTYHPDLSPSSSETFLQIKEAYTVLSNKKLRQDYDTKIQEKVENPVEFLKVNSIKKVLKAISNKIPKLKKIFSTQEIEISALESIRGVSKNLPGTNFKINIPAGVNDGDSVLANLPQQRNAIKLSIKVKNHPLVERKGRDIIFKVPVTEAEINLGSKVLVPTPSGSLSVKIPCGHNPNSLLRVQNCGFSLSSGKKADIFIKLEIANFSREHVQQKRELNLVVG